MSEESYSFAVARTRLEEIVSQVRKKDTSLEKSLDLLEEGVRLANQCTELIDHADWEAAAGRPDSAQVEGASEADADVQAVSATPEDVAGDDGAASEVEAAEDGESIDGSTE